MGWAVNSNNNNNNFLQFEALICWLIYITTQGHGIITMEFGQ